MPVPGRGHKSFIQMGKEVTYGTGVVATLRFEVISMDVHPEMGAIQDPSLNDQASRRGVFPGGIIYRGNFVVRANYQGLEELFRGVMGATGYTGGSLVDSARDHTFKETPALNSYTIEMIEGAPQNANICARLIGAYITGMTVRGTAGTGSDAMVQLEFSVMAKDKEMSLTPTAGQTAPSLFPVLYHQGITMDPGNADTAANVRIRSFEMSLDSPHTDDRFYLGSVNADQPIRSDFMTVRWRFTTEYVTETILTALKAGTIGSPQLIFQHPTLIGVSSKREFEIRSGLAIYTEEARPVDGYGIILCNTAMEAYNDGTGDASALVVRTKNALAALA